MSFEAVNTTTQNTPAPAAAIQALPQNFHLQKEEAEQKKAGGKLLIQAKLTVGAPDDPYEKEADTVADKVMRMPEDTFVQCKCASCEKEDPVQRKHQEDDEQIRLERDPSGAFIQRKCRECDEEKKEIISRKSLADAFIQRKCGECGEEKEEIISPKLLPGASLPFIQAKSNGEPATVSASLSSSIESNRGNGASLDNHTKSFMEHRMGADFSAVKIHTGRESVQMNRALNAQAFTTGNDIYFNEGRYQPHDNSGKKLLAHELTHVLQQTNSFSANSRLQPSKAVDTDIIQRAAPDENTDPLCPRPREEKPDPEAEKLRKTPFWELDYSNSIPPDLNQIPIEDHSPLFRDSLGSCSFCAKDDTPNQDAGDGSDKEDPNKAVKLITDLPKIPALHFPSTNLKRIKSQPAHAAGEGLTGANVQADIFDLSPLSKNILSRYDNSNIDNGKSGDQKTKNKTAQGLVNEISASVNGLIMRGVNLQHFVAHNSLRQKTGTGIYISQQYEEATDYFDQLIADVKTARRSLKNRAQAMYDHTYSRIFNEFSTTKDQLDDIGKAESKGLFDDWGANKDALFALYDFARTNMQEMGSNAGKKAAGRAAIWSSVYEYAIGWSEAVRAKVWGEAYDGFFTGKLHTQRTFFAMRDMAKKVGGEYDTGMKDQGDETAERIDCRKWSRLDAINAAYHTVIDALTLQENNGKILISNSATLNNHAALTLKEQTFQMIDDTWNRIDGQLKLMKEQQLNALTVARQQMLANIDKNSLQLRSSVFNGVSDAVNLLIANLDIVASQFSSGIIPRDEDMKLIENLFHEGLDAGKSDLLNIQKSFTIGLRENITMFIQGLQDKITPNREQAFLLTEKFSEFSDTTQNELESKLYGVYRCAKKELADIIKLYEPPMRSFRPLISRRLKSSLINIKAELCGTLKGAESEMQTIFTKKNIFDKTIVNAAQKAADGELKAYQKSAGYIKYIVIGFIIGLSIVLTAGLLTPAAVGLLGIGGVVVGMAVIGAVANAMVQITSNAFEGKPLSEGVFKAAVIGGVTGLIGGMGGFLFRNAGPIIGFISNIGLDVGTNIIVDLANGNEITLQGVLIGAAIGIGVGAIFHRLMSNPAIAERLPKFGGKAGIGNSKRMLGDTTALEKTVVAEPGSNGTVIANETPGNVITEPAGKIDGDITGNKLPTTDEPLPATTTESMPAKPGERGQDIDSLNEMAPKPHDTDITGTTDKARLPMIDKPSAGSKALIPPESPGGGGPGAKNVGATGPEIEDLPAGSVMQPASLDEVDTVKMYRNSIKDSPGREAGIYHNPKTNEFIIIQGDEVNVYVKGPTGDKEGPAGGSVQKWTEVLNGENIGSWELVAHYHPVEADGMVSAANRLPSGAEGDFDVLVGESVIAGNTKRSSRIDFKTERGDESTYFSYDPAEDKPFKIDYPDPVTSKRTKLEFGSLKEYHDWMMDTHNVDMTPGSLANPTAGSAAAPVKPPASPKVSGDKTRVETVEEFRQRGGEVTAAPPGKVPVKSAAEIVHVSEPLPPEGFEDIPDFKPLDKKRAGVGLAEDHHLATRYSKQNKKLFEKYGYHIDEDFNLIKNFEEHGQLRGWEKFDPVKKVYVHMERGHHPEYNRWVTRELMASVKGLRGKKASAALKSTVERLAAIVEANPDILAYGPDILFNPKKTE